MIVDLFPQPSLELNMATMVFNVREVRLDRQGYDRSGSYWGTGMRLYEYETCDELTDAGLMKEGHLRAYNREDCMDRIRSYFKAEGMVMFRAGFRTMS